MHVERANVETYRAFLLSPGTSLKIVHVYNTNLIIVLTSSHLEGKNNVTSITYVKK